MPTTDMPTTDMVTTGPARATETGPAPAGNRARLLDALGAAIVARGYRETTVADVVARARTSRRTFYELFDSKEECFLALLHEMSQDLRQRIVAAMDTAAPWDEQVRAGVTAWITTVASRPELSVSWIRELPSLGPTARAAQRAELRALIGLLVTATDTPAMRRAGVAPVTPATGIILLGGLRELAAGVLEDGDDIASITAPAVDAALALLGPRA